MKKALSVIALLLAATMIVMSFAACGDKKDDNSDSKSEVSPLKGEYYLNYQIYMGKTYDREVLEDVVGGETTLVIDADSSGTLTIPNQETISLTFDTDNNTVKSNDGRTGTFTLNGVVLEITVDGRDETYGFIQKSSY